MIGSSQPFFVCFLPASGGSFSSSSLSSSALWHFLIQFPICFHYAVFSRADFDSVLGPHPVLLLEVDGFDTSFFVALCDID